MITNLFKFNSKKKKAKNKEEVIITPGEEKKEDSKSENSDDEDNQEKVINFSEIITCGICFEKYDNENKKPYVLECGHTLCKTCLTSILSYEPRKCPYDKKDLKYNTANKYPINYSYLDLVNQVENIPIIKYKEDKSNKINNEAFSFTFPLEDGEYTGSFKEDSMNIRHGYGIMNYKNGNVYKGNFKNNKKCGYGVQNNADGSIYEGKWKNDIQNGKGKFTFPVQEPFLSFEGNWKGGKEFGPGKLIYKNGTELETIFLGGLNKYCEIINVKDGNGSKFTGRKLEEGNNNIYIGYQVSTEGNIYSGTFEFLPEGKLIKNGDFQIFMKNGSQITCKITDNSDDFEGEIIFENGDTYAGHIKNGKREGKGTTFYKDGGIHTGIYNNGLRNGYGKYEKGNYTYEGDFKDDLMDGNGFENFDDGQKYCGEYKNGLKHGKGILIDKEGKGTEGLFENDIFINDLNKRNNQSFDGKDCIVF